MKKKVFKKIRGVFLSFCALFLCGFNLCTNVNLNKIDSAGASGFTDVTELPNPIVSIDFVYSDNSTSSYTFDNLDPYNKNVPNGFSVFDLISSISGNPLYNCVSFYMSLDFGSSLFNTGKYDLFLSSSNPIWSTQAYSSTNQLLTVSIEDYFLNPMDVFRIAKVSVSYGGEITPFKTALFRFDGYYFRNMLSMYQQGYFDYYCFAYDFTANSDFEIAYSQGYDNGFFAGQSDGYDSGYESGYSAGSSQGYNEGYTTALNEGGFANLISAVIDVPVSTFFGLFHFDLLGVNMASFLLAIFTLAVIIIVIKKIIF